MPVTAANIAKLAALGAPVLCFDTCSVLDILRDPTRETVREHEQRAALDLVNHMETGQTLVGLIAHQVRVEFDSHVDAVAAEATEALDRLRRQLLRMDALASVFGRVGRADLQHLDDYVTRARAVVDRLMTTTSMVPGSQAIASRALLRLNQARTPARKGKDSMRDCVVIETYLDIISSLRSARLGSKIVFVSSNTKDYTGIGGALKPDLRAEFAHTGMEYAPNLAAAKHFLGL